jgi:hypothetical protein
MGTQDDSNSSVTAAARLALSQWHARLGAAGMAAMAALPGLLAAVDQHAAEVRDTLADRRGRCSLPLLAAYADGVADRATAKGWRIDEVADGRWGTASWASLRLLAVSVLAATAVDVQAA